MTERRAALLAMLVIAAVTALSWWVEQPEAPAPASAPADRFSADRAWPDLEAIAVPTPLGSPAGDTVRDHLVARLTALGLAPQVRAASGIVAKGQSVTAGRADDVVATLPGTASTGRVIVAAHYDTTQGGPGAADDKASVAAVLEIARALQAGPRPRNDVVFLLTGGEEPGLLGASAFARQDPTPGVVVNGEGPGNAGPSGVVQTSTGAGPVIAAFAADAEHPVGDSVVPSIFPLLGNHTDLTVLDQAGFAGLTLGFTDGRAYFHSPLDTPANLTRAGFQQHGDTLLSLVRGLGDRAVPDLLVREGPTTFFTLFGVVVHYGEGTTTVLALVAVVVVVVLGELAIARRRTTGPRLVGGLLGAALALATASAAGSGLWALLTRLQPGYHGIDPYRPDLYRAAVGVLAAAVVLVWFALLRRMAGALALAIGALALLAVAGAVLAAKLPGTAFVADLPVLVAGVALAAGLLVPRRWRVIVPAVGVGLAALLLLAAGRTTLQGAGIAAAGAATVAFAAFGLVALPLVETVLGRRTLLTPLLLLVVTGGLVAAGVRVDRFDAQHPRPTDLAYVADTSAHTTSWVSTDAVPPDWTRRHTPSPAVALPPLPDGARALWRGPAPDTHLPAPELTVLGTRPVPGGTAVTVHLRSPRGAGLLVLHADRPATAVSVALDGAPVATPLTPGGENPDWPLRLQVYDPPAAGATVELTVADAPGLRFRVADVTTGLDGLPGYTPRPPELVRSSARGSDTVVVSRTVP